MLSLVLVGALAVQAVIAAPPQNCVEFCDDQSTVGSANYGGAKSSYSSYAKSSYDQRMQRYSSSSGGLGSAGSVGSAGSLGSAGGLGSTGGRLENFDENVINTAGLDRPGNWQDEKHYVTDDGRGQMSYRAGQTVTNNGFSKFAQHSYRYGTHDKHAPLSNSQVLSTAEFNNELSNMRNRIASFMGNFHFGSDSTMNANMLQEFKNKASLISSQMDSVCNQVDVGSSMHRQMQQMMQQFQNDVEQKQREMEAMIYQSSSSSSTVSHGSLTHGSTYRPMTQYAPIQQQQPSRPSEDVLIQRRVDEEFTKIRSLITTFYNTFNRVDTNLQYQQDLSTQVNAILDKLSSISFEAQQNESMRKVIENTKTQFESYVAQIRTRIQEMEDRNREEEARRKEHEMQLLIEKQAYEEKMRKLEEERIRLERENEEKKRLREAEEERLRLQAEAERQQREREERERLLLVEQQQQQLQLQQQQLQLQQQQQQLQQQQQAVSHKPQVGSSTVEVTGSSSYHHSIKGSYGSQVHDNAGSSYIQGSSNQGSYARPQQVIQPHVDLTAVISRLQQDLNRLQNEVNNFNMYTMRLTSSNSATVVTEAERQAESLRQSIKNLCETSGRYENQNILNSAEDLSRRFEELFRSFQSRAANYTSESSFSSSGGYSASSSYGSTAKYGTVHAPSVGNVEFEHSKSTDIEVGRRPASSQRYSSGGNYNSQTSYGARADGQYQSGLIDLGGGSSGSQQQVECVEAYAGQPCVNQPRRYKRNVGEYGPYFEQMPDFDQHHQPIFDDLPRLEDYTQQQHVFGPPLGYFGIPTTFDNLSQHAIGVNYPRGFPRAEDLTRYPEEIDDFYGPRGSAEWQQHANDDLTQQHTSFAREEDLESLDKPRSQVISGTRSQTQTPGSTNLRVEKHSEWHRESSLDNRYSSSDRPLVQFGRTTTERPLHVLTTFDTPKTDDSEEFTVQKGGFGDLTLESETSDSTTTQTRPYVLSRPRSTTFRPGHSDEETEQFNLQNSGFYDSVQQGQVTQRPRVAFARPYEHAQSATTEKPRILEKETETPQQVRPLVTFGQQVTTPDSRIVFEEETERPLEVSPLLTFGKPTSTVESHSLTLENSGFYDNLQRSEVPKTTDSSRQVQQVTQSSKAEFVGGSEDFTLQKSGFYDYPIENRKPEASDKIERLRPPSVGNLEITQQSQGVFQQQSNFEGAVTDNRKLEKPALYDGNDLAHQTVSQVDFGLDSQFGREFSSQSRNPQQKPLMPPVAHSIQISNNNYSGQSLQSADSHTERIYTATENQGLLPTVRPTIKPAPKPVPRYTRPWQISQLDDLPKQAETVEDDHGTENASVAETDTQKTETNSDKYSQSLRGDLPGSSEPTTTPLSIEEKPYITIDEKPDINDNQKSQTDFDSQQQYEQVNLNANDELNNLQKPRNEWEQNGSGIHQFSQSNRAYYFNQQRIHHNSEYSQQPNYYNQNNGKIELGQQIQNPVSQQNNFDQLNHQSNLEFNQKHESTYQFHQQHSGNLQIEAQGQNQYDLKPAQFGQKSQQLSSNGQEDFSQKSQDPLLEREFSELEFNQQSQKALLIGQENSKKLNDNLVAGKVPFDETKLVNGDTESSTQTFWKRVGHKLSSSYDKAKERARTIFG